MTFAKFVYLFFFLLCVEAIFSVFLLNWELAVAATPFFMILLFFFGTLLTCLALWTWRSEVSGALFWATAFSSSSSKYRWLGFCFVVGSLLRLLWAWHYPAPQQSDHATYVALAKLCFEKHSYGFPGALAYWPPGYPFFLDAFFHLFGVHNWVPLATNIVLFGGQLFVVERLATRIVAGAGRVASLLLTAWPTLVMSANLASKEMLVLFLLTGVLLVFSNALDDQSILRQVLFATVAGLLLGCATLTQPSLQLFPAVLLTFVWARGRAFLRGFGLVLPVAVAMAVVVFPWTLRNHRVFAAWVTVSTNGGDVFYRANNPLATGGYTQRGEQSLESYDELTRNRVGFRLGKRWIAEHPAKFIGLAFRKQILFLGDDAQGAYETLKRGLNIGGLSYAAWKGISNLYWLLVWLLVCLTCITYWSERERLSEKPLLLAVMMSVFYLYSIHSVFESGAKYHQPVIGFLAVLAALAFVRRDVSNRQIQA